MPFKCPVCNECLYVPHLYSRLQAIKALLLSGILCFAFGARGAYLVLASFLAWIPLGFVVLFWATHFAPPSLRPCRPDDSSIQGLGL
jgi:hypothetical protein